MTYFSLIRRSLLPVLRVPSSKLGACMLSKEQTEKPRSYEEQQTSCSWQNPQAASGGLGHEDKGMGDLLVKVIDRQTNRQGSFYMYMVAE